MNNLIQKVFETMNVPHFSLNGDANVRTTQASHEQSEKLIRYFESLAPAHQKIVDQAFVILCNWPLSTNIKEYKHEFGESIRPLKPL